MNEIGSPMNLYWNGRESRFWSFQDQANMEKRGIRELRELHENLFLAQFAQLADKKVFLGGDLRRRPTLLFARGDSILPPVHKIAFELGPLTVSWYGVFVATGFLFGLWNASRRALRRNLSPETIFDCGTWLLIGAILRRARALRGFVLVRNRQGRP